MENVRGDYSGKNGKTTHSAPGKGTGESRRGTVYPITLPPLRSRREDIPLLIAHFISVFNRKFGKHIEEIPPIVMETLINYDWLGNIRELQNVLERVVITNSGSNFQLPDGISEYQNSRGKSSVTDPQLRPLAEAEKNIFLAFLNKRTGR